ncbi:hypothetical protein niasHT_032051 [Heterodera trifolii]|uniref:Fibronectin type-III domain-containing protein n=1 Tax=Heterodera trifolii TaxID=157864 RepID=A0ABD2II24_9BILA
MGRAFIPSQIDGGGARNVNTHPVYDCTYTDEFEAPRFELDDINGKEVHVRAGHANTRQYIPKSVRHFITLSWRPPKDDGGAELSGYSIEFKGLDERDWERVPDHVTLPNYTVRNLEKTTQYQFRVFAENMVGISEPLNGEPCNFDPVDYDFKCSKHHSNPSSTP